GTGTTAISLANSFTAVNVAKDTTLTLSATVSGTGLAKLGAGTLALSGSAANSNSGNTVVAGGTLLLTKTAAVVAVNASSLVINPNNLVQIATSDSQINAVNVRVLAGATLDLHGRNATV